MPGIYVALIHTVHLYQPGSLLYEYFSGHIICVCLCASLCISSLLIFIPTLMSLFYIFFNPYIWPFPSSAHSHSRSSWNSTSSIKSSLTFPGQRILPILWAATVLYVYFSFTFNHFLLYLHQIQFHHFSAQLWINQLNFQVSKFIHLPKIRTIIPNI